MDVAVLGTGSWGTALARVLASHDHRVTMWGIVPAQVAAIAEKHENTFFLPGVALPPSLRATTDLGEALAGARLVVAVVPSQAMREALSRAAPFIEPDAVVVSAAKGIENRTLATMDEVIAQALPPSVAGRAVFLSGPSFAREVAEALPTAVVVASRDPAAAEVAQAAFGTDRFRVYTSDDVPGVELGGALKNVIAVAAGIADGLGFGHNARAALITRGLAEITRLAVKRGANPLTLAGLAGMGDLVLTCTGDLSRNRTVGIQLGQGRKIGEILAGMTQVAEGVSTALSAHQLAQREHVDMPITEMVHSVLYEDKPVLTGVVELLGRPMRPERG